MRKVVCVRASAPSRLLEAIRRGRIQCHAPRGAPYVTFVSRTLLFPPLSLTPLALLAFSSQVRPTSLSRFFEKRCADAEAMKLAGSLLGTEAPRSHAEHSASSTDEATPAGQTSSKTPADQMPVVGGMSSPPEMGSHRWAEWWHLATAAMPTGQMSLHRATISFLTLSLVSNGGNLKGFGYEHSASPALLAHCHASHHPLTEPIRCLCVRQLHPPRVRVARQSGRARGGGGGCWKRWQRWQRCGIWQRWGR